MLINRISGGLSTPYGHSSAESLQASVRDLAGYFHRLGIGSGLRVGLRMMHTDLHLRAILALQALGAQSVELGTVPVPELADMAAALEIGAILVDKADHGLPDTLPVIPLLELPKSEGEPSQAALAPQPDEAVFRCFTSSGTTGRPKLVPLTLHAFCGRLETRCEVNPVPAGCRLLLGMHLAAEVILTYAVHYLSHGADVVFPRSFDSVDMIQSIRAHQVTHMVTSPHVLERLVAFLNATETSLPGVQAIYLVGAQASRLVQEMAHKWIGAPLFSDYGSTETGVIALKALDVQAPSSSVGKVHDPAALKIVDQAGKPVPCGAKGWVSYRGRNLCEPYWQADEAHDVHFPAGRFMSGDIGWLNEAGELFIEGRADDLINRGGVKIVPQSIEEQAKQLPGISDCAAFGVTVDGKTVVVLAIAGNPSAEQKASWLEQTQAFGEFLRPDLVVYLKEIPRNPNGKILRRELAAFFAGKIQSG